MIPRISRGYQFKGVASYLMRDKREEGELQPQTQARVGFTHALNFQADFDDGDMSRAAKLMAWTWQNREHLKRTAGIRPGGSVCSATTWVKAGGDQDARRDRVAGRMIVAAEVQCNA